MLRYLSIPDLVSENPNFFYFFLQLFDSRDTSSQTPKKKIFVSECVGIKENIFNENFFYEFFLLFFFFFFFVRQPNLYPCCLSVLLIPTSWRASSFRRE